MPWTYAIRASEVTSLRIETDTLRADNPDRSTKRFHDATEEEVRSVPAVIEITTRELTSGGEQRSYTVRGLNHATAPPLLGKILGAISDAAKEPSRE